MREAAPKLGRGLAALLGQDAPAAPTAPGGPERLLQIDAAEIGPNPEQPRASIDAENLRELTASIAQQGVLQPILVRESDGAAPRYRIIAGERRWRAAIAAGLSHVPCVVRHMSDSDASLAALVENLQREDLNALEEAEGLRRALQRFGLTQDALARALGKSRSHIANTLRLLNLPLSVREHLRAGRLSAGHARALLSHADPEAAARAVIARGLNVRQTEAMTTPAPEAPPTKPVRDPDITALERDLTEKLGLAVRITDRGGNGRVAIAYRSLEQLDGLIRLLTGG